MFLVVDWICKHGRWCYTSLARWWWNFTLLSAYDDPDANLCIPMDYRDHTDQVQTSSVVQSHVTNFPEFVVYITFLTRVFDIVSTAFSAACTLAPDATLLHRRSTSTLRPMSTVGQWTRANAPQKYNIWAQGGPTWSAVVDIAY